MNDLELNRFVYGVRLFGTCIIESPFSSSIYCSSN